MKQKPVNDISAEVLSAFLDGNATAQECDAVMEAFAEDAQLRELFRISQSVDAALGIGVRECEILPMTAMAASCGEENYCCLECEKYILRHFNIAFDEHQLLKEAVQNGWQKENGTALHNVGRHLEAKGLAVSRQYKAAMHDIIAALDDGDGVIVAVDGGELLGNRAAEIQEDILVGCIPDHTVVVLSYDAGNQSITIHDPNSSNAEDCYPVEQFEDAWNDSKNYLVTINFRNMKNYNPKPIDLSDVELTDDLNELREAIAKNAHDVWAVERQTQGWTYGPHRDDDKKQTPCMVEYAELPDSEKKFDRDMAMNTLKLVRKLGYDLVKREETELYRLLMSRVRDNYYCPKCKSRGILTPVCKYDIFCNHCGDRLEIDWSLHK